jgi:hypothetical protein
MKNEDEKHSASRRAVLRAGVCAASLVGLGISSAQAAKASKGSVGYRDTPNGDKNCAGCSLFVSPNACKSVEGQISPNGWCRIWKA